MDEQLRAVQMKMLAALRVFDDICRRHGLRYSLHGGTLLGAVRHKGFIPWDDDLDVIMPRADFNRLLRIWDQEDPKGYFLQTKEKEEDYTRSFAKIRLEHTTFLLRSEKAETIHTGIFIDIFPADRLPRGWLLRKLFSLHSMVYQLYTREFVPPRSGRLTRFMSGIMLRLTSHRYRMKRREQLLRKITRYGEDDTLPWVVTDTPKQVRRPIDRALFDKLVPLPFEDGSFQCTAIWDKLLTTWYGDYMTVPPEEQRKTHHPFILDLDHDYHELTALRAHQEEKA